MEASNPEDALKQIEAAMANMEALSKPGAGRKVESGRRTAENGSRKAKPGRRSAESEGRKTSGGVREARSTRAKPRSTQRTRTPDPRPPTPPNRPPTPKGPLHQRIISFLVGLAVMLVLPFYVLLRGSVFLYQEYAVWPWLAIAGGTAATVLLLMLYAAWLRWRLGSGFRFSKGVTRGLVVLVAMYVGYTAMYISASNVKTEEVHETYTALHPLLRLATSTFVLIDNDVVVTDGERSREDYAAMGLPVNEGSLHFRQEDTGYAHAVDLRTKGREEWKNFLMTIYFKAAGFRTLRHTGTADHLHVSLPKPSTD